MTFPAVLFGVLISTLYGTSFHLLRGGGLGRLLLFLVLGWAGFWAGHMVGEHFDFSLVSLGPINLGAATLSSAVFLWIGGWLSRIEPHHAP